MGLLQRLMRIFKPLRLMDPDFGQLTYMHIQNDESLSYWEAEWFFPAVNRPVFITISGNETGPFQEHRDWYLKLVPLYDEIQLKIKPHIATALERWSQDQSNKDVLETVQLVAINVVDPSTRPVEWSLSYETVRGRWLHISLPIVGKEIKEAQVDT